MLNRNYIGKDSFGVTRQILADVSNQVSIGCIVPQDLAENVDGRKIVRAGTPIHMDTMNPLIPVTAPGGGDASDGYRKTITFDPEVNGTKIVVNNVNKFWAYIKNIDVFEANNHCGLFVLAFTNGTDASDGFMIMNIYIDEEGTSQMDTFTDIHEDDLASMGAVYNPNGTPSPIQADGFEFYVAPDVDYILTGTAPIIKQDTGGDMYGWDKAFNPYDRSAFPFTELFNTAEEYVSQFKNTNNYHLEFKPSARDIPPHTKVIVSTDTGVVSTGQGAIDPEYNLVNDKAMFYPYDRTDSNGRLGILQLAPGKTWQDLYSEGDPLWINIEKRAKNVGGGIGNGGSNMNAVLLHDVDVTFGPANGTALLFGTVNMNRLDANTRSKVEPFIGNNDSHILFLAY